MTDINLDNYEAFLLDLSEGSLSAEDTVALKAFLILHPELAISPDDLELPVLSEEPLAFGPTDFLKKTDTDVPDEELLNYIEGRLSLEQTIAFAKKLEQDAELAGDLALYQKTILTADTGLVFEHKNALLRNEDDLVLNDRVVAYVEGQLSAVEAHSFEQELNGSATLQKELALVRKTILAADTAVVYPDKAALKKEGRVVALFSFGNVTAMAAALLLLVGLAVVFNFNADPSTQQHYSAKSNPSEQPATTVKKSATGVSSPSNTSVQAQKEEATLAAKQIEKQQPVPGKAVKTVEEQAPVQKQKEPAPLVAQQHKQPKQSKHSLRTEPKETITQDVAVQPVANGTAQPQTDTPQGYEPGPNHQTWLATVEEGEEDDLPAGQLAAASRRSFWEKAAHLAQRMNKLGVKSVDGVERGHKGFSFSFNSFSVEKK